MIESLVYFATIQGFQDAFSFLLWLLPSTDMIIFNDQSILDIAIESNQADAALFLLEKGADINRQTFALSKII